MTTPTSPYRTQAIRGLTEHTADLDGVRIHYRRGGDPAGPPVLLWHGFLATGFAWRDVAPLLVDAGYHVLVPDMRGYGDSDKPPGDHGYDGRALAEEFRALARAIGFGAETPITLVAHDMGGPPALLWAADHPDEIERLFYIEVPVMLADVLEKVLAYTPATMARGSMWWWILPLAPGVPERLIVGNERAFLTWFFERHPADLAAVGPEAVEEYLRTFTGTEGVLGALGVYRTAFTTIDQTTPLTTSKVTVPVTAVGGDRAQGGRIGEMVARVAARTTSVTLANCGHFVPEEHPSELVALITKKGSSRSTRASSSTAP